MARHDRTSVSHVLVLLVLTALLPPGWSRPALRIAVVHEESRIHPGIEFVGLDRFEAIFGDSNRTILPDHDVVFDRILHGPYDGDAAEVFGEISAPWSTKYAAVVGFDDDSVNETTRFAATQRVLQVHHAKGPHLSNRDKYPYQFRSEPSEHLQIITQFYMAAGNGWTQVVCVWNSVGSMDSSEVAALRYNVSEYARLRTRGAEEHLFGDVSDHITTDRTRTVMSLLPLEVTIDLVCSLHVDGHRGLQYFFPLYFKVGWWTRVGDDYPCTPAELYAAAQGHIYVAPTPFTPGMTFLATTIPAVAPFGDQSNIPLACGGGSAQEFYEDLVASFLLLVNLGLGLEEAAEEFYKTGREYTALCATMLAFHDLLYVKGAGLGALENRDLTTFQALVDSLQTLEFQAPSGPFRYVPGSGEMVPVFHIALQFAEDGTDSAYLDLNELAEINILFTYGNNVDPTPHFYRPLVWRGGSTGLGLHNSHLNVFPDCAEVNGVLDGEVCLECQPGTIFDAGSRSCIICPLGSYQNESGKTSCESSPAGFYIPDVEQPNDILPCPLGSSCPQQGTLIPLTCHAGQFAHTTGMSACALCEQGSFQTQPGASACSLCSGSFAGATTPERGASSELECMCVQGTYRGFDDSIGCLPCPTGMACPLGSDVRNIPDRDAGQQNTSSSSFGGSPYPHAMVGFMTLSENPLFAYQCLDEDRDICPGGPPGACGAHRAHDVIACGECDDESYQYGETTSCETCGSFSWLPATLVAIAAFIACVLITIVTNVTLHVTPGTAMTMSAVVGLIVTSSQTLHILLKMEIAWGGLFASIASCFGLFSLQTKLVKIGCVLGNTPVTTYLVAQLVAPLSVPVIALILRFEKHLLPKLARTTSLRVPLVVSLSNTAGTIVCALFISIVLLCAVPFICYSHQGSNIWSLLSAPSVLCYSFEGSQYLGFVVIGLAVFFCLPVPFLVTCMYFCMIYPSLVLASENHDYLLRATRFMFYRFKPVRYYFIMLLLGKHLVLGLVPAVFPDQSRLQALAIALVLALYSFTQSVLWPWRSNVLNVADALACLTLLLIVVCGSLGMNDTDGRPLIQTVDGTLATFLFGMLSLACALGLHERFNQKKYHFFICHHKADAAAQARYLKMVLQQLRTVRVFIDSDDLSDLDVLFDTIKTSVQQLVLYITSETLRRPWCIGEVVTSMKAKIRILPIRAKACPAFTDGYIEEVVTDVVNGSELADFDIGADDIKESLRKLMGVPVIQLKSENYRGSSRFYKLAQDILSGNGRGALNPLMKANSLLFQPAMPPTPQVSTRKRRPSLTQSYGGQVIVSTLPDSDEALATGGIIKLAIGEMVFRTHNAIVNLLEDDARTIDNVEEIITTSLAVVAVLSPGTLHAPEQIRVILVASCFIAAGTIETCVIPVTTPGFEFPDSEYYRIGLPLVNPDKTLMDPEDLVKSFFRLISIFLPTHGSQQVLETSCMAIMDRLEVQCKTVPQSRRRQQLETYTSSRYARKESCRYGKVRSSDATHSHRSLGSNVSKSVEVNSTIPDALTADQSPDLEDPIHTPSASAITQGVRSPAKGGNGSANIDDWVLVHS